MTKSGDDVRCPICGEVKKRKGMFFHFRNNHAKEFNELGYGGIMDMAKSADAVDTAQPKVTKKKASPKLAASKNIDREPTENVEDDIEEERAFEALQKISKHKYWFNPSPSAAAIINEFGNVRDPTELVNKAIIEYGKNRGIEPAIIKTGGGKALRLVGDGVNDDKEFNRLMKLMQVNATQNQSYSQFSPTVQMMQLMKEKVNSGMSMGEFMKNLMQMRMQESVMSQRSNNPMALMLMMSRFMKKRR